MSTQLPTGSAAAARRVTGRCGDFTLGGVKFRVVCRGNLEIGARVRYTGRFVGNIYSIYIVYIHGIFILKIVSKYLPVG